VIDGYNTHLTPEGYTLEPIGKGKYLVAKDGHLEIIEITNKLNPKNQIPIKNEYEIVLGKSPNQVSYDINPARDELLTNAPTEAKLLEEIAKNPKLILGDLFLELIHALKITLDLEHEQDYFLVALFILQSYKKEFLNAYFYLSADADKGSAKTILLENISNLAYRSELVGGISTASLRDLVSRYKSNILLDEIDQISKELKSDVMSILRKGQRSGNKIVKQVYRDGDWRPQQFDASGSHAFVYRSKVEDALQDRSLSIQPKISFDNTLPVINFHKELISSSLVVKLFLWRTTSYALSVKRKSSLVVEVVDVVEGMNYPEIRRNLFKQFTARFTPETLEYMNTLYGRNMELYYVISTLARLTGLQLNEHLEKIFDKKKDESNFSEDIYEEYIANVLRELYLELKNYELGSMPNKYKLKRGDFIDCYAFPTSEFNLRLTTKLRSDGVSVIGTDKRLSLLRGFGFVKGKTWGRNQKIGRPYASPCLIFSREIKKKLQIDKIEAEKEKEDKEIQKKLQADKIEVEEIKNE